MKHPLDNQTVDWVENRMVGSLSQTHVSAIERFVAVIKLIETLPIATVKEINKQVMPGVSSRQTQRYLCDLIDAGYVRRIGDSRGFEHRYFLTDKSKQLFNVTKRDGEGR